MSWAHGDVLMGGTEIRATDALVDLTSAVLVLNYVKILRRIVVAAAVVCLLLSLLRQSMPLAAAGAVGGAAYIALRRYYRPVLLALTWAAIPNRPLWPHG